MKSSVGMVAVFAALVATVKADGVCYDPNHGNPSPDGVKKDMDLIKSRGFSMVRTYITKLGGFDMADVVAHSGLSAALGVPTEQGNYMEQADAAIKAVQSGGNVKYIFCGNERDADQNILNCINHVKEKLGGGFPVGTVMRTDQALNTGGMWSTVYGASNVVGVNIHPFFHPGIKINNAIEETKRQWQAAKGKLGGKLVLTETGWPTNGAAAGDPGSYDNAKKYWNQYKGWGEIPNDRRFYFQGFDTPYKGGGYEGNYGIWTSAGGDKFAAGGNGQGVGGATTSAPATTAPAATTAAPAATTTKPVVANNATNVTTAPVAVDTKQGSTAGSTVGSVVLTFAPAAGGEEENVVVTAPVSPSPINPEGKPSSEIETLPEASSVSTQNEAGSSNFAGVFIMTLFGVGIVAVAAGFIYKARQKASELDRESKGSLSITPGGACVL